MKTELTAEQAAEVMSALEEKAYNDSSGDRLEELLDLSFRKFELPEMMQDYQHTGDPADARLVEDELFEVEAVVDAEHSENGFAFLPSITAYADVENIAVMHGVVVEVASRVLPLGWTIKGYDGDTVSVVPNKCSGDDIKYPYRNI